jgi:ribose transport system substrate-binding protein
MSIRNKWLPLLISLTVLMLVMAACQGSAPANEEAAPAAEEEATQEGVAEEEMAEEEEMEPVRLALFHTVLGNTYTKAVTDGAQEAADEMGATLDVFGADPAFDPVSQSNQIQDAIVSGNYDVFLIYAVDGNAVLTDVEDAIAAGIMVVAVDVVIGPDPRAEEPCCGVTSYVGRTGYGHGLKLAEMMVRACETVEDTTCKIGYLNGAQSLTVDQERVAAIEEVLAEHPDIEIVAMQDAFYLQDEGYNVAQNMLQANPDINVFATSGDQMMLGAEQAVIDAGREGEIILIGNGTGERGYEAIAEGRFFCGYADIPYTMGKIAGEIAIKAFHGEEVPTFVSNDDQSPPLPPSGPIICSDNVDQFEPQW